MNEWKRASRDALISGAAAGALSALAMALAGQLERRAPAGPLNGPSQWVFGRGAAHRRGFSVRHTLTGLFIHHAMAMGWALLHERVFGQSKTVQPASRVLRNAALTTTVANIVDYQLTPRRLQPGFDVQLSRKAMFGIYAAFGIGLALYDLAKQRRPAANVARRHRHPLPDSRV